MDAGKRSRETAGAGRRFLETPQGARAWGVQHECAREAAVAMDTAPTPPPASLSSLQPELRVGISLGAGPECQEMSPTLYLPGRSLLGLPDLCGYQGLLAQLLRRMGRPGRAAQGSRSVGGGSYTIPSGLSKAGELKGPWQLPRPLCPGKETTA